MPSPSSLTQSTVKKREEGEDLGGRVEGKVGGRREGEEKMWCLTSSWHQSTYLRDKTKFSDVFISRDY